MASKCPRCGNWSGSELENHVANAHGSEAGGGRGWRGPICERRTAGPSRQAPPGEEAEEGGAGKAPKKSGRSNGRCRRQAGQRSLSGMQARNGRSCGAELRNGAVGGTSEGEGRAEERGGLPERNQANRRKLRSGQDGAGGSHGGSGRRAELIEEGRSHGAGKGGVGGAGLPGGGKGGFPRPGSNRRGEAPAEGGSDAGRKGLEELEGRINPLPPGKRSIRLPHPHPPHPPEPVDAPGRRSIPAMTRVRAAYALIARRTTPACLRRPPLPDLPGLLPGLVPASTSCPPAPPCPLNPRILAWMPGEGTRGQVTGRMVTGRWRRRGSGGWGGRKVTGSRAWDSGRGVPGEGGRRRTQAPDAGRRAWDTSDTGHGTQIYRTPDMGHGTPDTGCRTPDIGHIGHGAWDIGRRTSDTGHRT